MRFPKVRPTRQGGFSALEVFCAVVILTVAATAFCQSLVKGLCLADSTHQRALATQQARSVLEEIEEASFDQAFALYNASAADDPGPNAPGAGFAVSGLTPLANDADGLAGSIVFPVSGTQLRENLTLRTLGMPHDLNGDGAIDALNHAGDYRLLPVLVRVAWRGPNGPMQVELRTILSER